MQKVIIVASLVALLVTGCTITPKNSHIEPLQIVNRVPEGTISGLVDENKVVHGILNEINIKFNNDINEATLISDNFYALWGIDDKIPSSIVYNKQKRTATLKFNNPLKAKSSDFRISVVLQNIKDVNGSFLDKYIYNIDLR